MAGQIANFIMLSIRILYAGSILYRKVIKSLLQSPLKTHIKFSNVSLKLSLKFKVKLSILRFK
jgi:hypothetical protein